METNTTKRTDLFLVDPRNVDIVADFNVRREFDLEELKEQIKANGVLNPITVIAYKVNGQERYKLVDGERRYRATMMAIAEGANIPYIKALKAPKDATVEDLYIEQMMRNEGKKFTEYECAIMFKRFKDDFHYTQVEIADKFKKSTAFVSKCLSLLELPKEIQDKIVAGELSVKAAKEIADSYESEKEQVRAARNAVKQAREQGRTTATNKEVLNALKESKEAREIADNLRKIWAYMDWANTKSGPTLVDVDELIRLLDKHKNFHQAMREYKQNNNR